MEMGGRMEGKGKGSGRIDRGLGEGEGMGNMAYIHLLSSHLISSPVEMVYNLRLRGLKS